MECFLNKFLLVCISEGQLAGWLQFEADPNTDWDVMLCFQLAGGRGG